MEPAPPEDDDEDADVDTRRTRTHCIAELRGGALSAASDGGDWGGVSADVTARAAAVAVSTRRLQLLSELQGLLDGGGRGGDSENFGVPLLEGAILGLSASLTTDVHRAPGPSVTGSIGRRVHRAPGPPTSIGRRVTFNVEAQTLLDFLNHHKGAWQGLTLVHFSSQHQRFLWVRGCI